MSDLTGTTQTASAADPRFVRGARWIWDHWPAAVSILGTVGAVVAGAWLGAWISGRPPEETDEWYWSWPARFLWGSAILNLVGGIAAAVREPRLSRIQDENRTLREDATRA